MSPARRDFVGIYRAAMADIFGRFEDRTLILLLWLICEADHRTGAVLGSVRTLSTDLGWDRESVAAHIGELVDAGEVTVEVGVNRYQKGLITVTRYAEYVMTGSSSGGVSGGVSGGTARPLQRADQGKRRSAAGDNTTTLSSARSAPFVAFAQVGAKQASRTTEEPEQDHEERTEEEPEQDHEELAEVKR